MNFFQTLLTDSWEFTNLIDANRLICSSEIYISDIRYFSGPFDV